METSRYRFRSGWHVDAAPGAVFEVLADISSYPRWWPQVRSVQPIDDDNAALVCRSLLPYTLRLRARRVREDARHEVLEARLSGDLEGWSRWSLRPHGRGTALHFEQEVVLRRALPRRLGLVGRPVLRFNHAWMMRGARRGLSGRVNARCRRAGPAG